MPQIFQVLRCYKCSVFQVHQTNKSNKWECKLCGEKQSVKRYYGLGTAKECRFHVQKLNAMRGELDGKKNNTDPLDSSTNEDTVTQPVKDNYKPVQGSKWSHYVEETETVAENINKTSLGGAEVVLEIPKKRRKLNINNIGNPKFTTVDHGKPITSPEIVANSMVNLINIESKAPQPSFHSEDSIQPEEPMNKMIYNHIKKFIPPVINKNSKWAQFTEEPDETEQTNIVPTESTQTSQNDELFSWCDDADLDTFYKNIFYNI